MLLPIIGSISTTSGSVPFEGPLDLVPGAIVAYSLSRALSTDWLGENIIRLRRSSDDAELDFAADLITGLVDQAAVAAWHGVANPFTVTAYDQSGNGNNCTWATKAEQPPYVANAIGGRAAMQGTDTTAALELRCGEIMYPNGGYTGFIVAKGSGSRFLAALTSPDDMEFNLGFSGGYDFVYIQDADSNDAGIGSTVVLDTNYHVCDVRGKFDDCDAFVDGVSVGTGEFTDGTGPIGVMTIATTRWVISGGNSGTTLGAAELIMYATFPPDPDRLLVRQNQQAFYSTPALP